MNTVKNGSKLDSPNNFVQLHKKGITENFQGDTIPISMTVCIAALAEDGKKAVLVADKLVTTTGLLPYQTDMAADKIVKINDNVTVMFSGGITDASIIIERSIKNIGQNQWVGDIANLINNKHLEYLLEILSRSQLTTRGIKDVNEFYRDYSLKLDQGTKGAIDNVLTTFTLNSNPQFIVCGKESDGNYKVYWLSNNPRAIPALMTNNYSIIGSGGTFAGVSLIQSKYDKSFSVEKVKRIVLKAKKVAENDQNVGPNHDSLILV